MKTVTTPVTVEWADCDPAGIVYYPRFLAWFDKSSWNLFYRVGLTWEVMTGELNGRGFPVLDVQATFLYPCRLKDELVVTSAVTEWSEKTFTLTHRVHNGEHEAVTGHEVRFWGVAHPDDPRRLKAGPIPDEVRRRLG